MDADAFCETLGCHELQIIERRMVFGKSAILGLHDRAERQIDAWRAVLPFVAAAIQECVAVVWLACFRDCGKCNAVGERVFRTRGEIGPTPFVTDTSQRDNRRPAVLLTDSGAGKIPRHRRNSL
jgi:hypothetical protein